MVKKIIKNFFIVFLINRRPDGHNEPYNSYSTNIELVIEYAMRLSFNDGKRNREGGGEYEAFLKKIKLIILGFLFDVLYCFGFC